MLNLLIRKNRRIFDAMAQAWIEAGAQSFQVLNVGHQPIASWTGPVNGTEPHPVVTVQIDVGHETLGELTVVGINGESTRSRLAQDAQLLRKWLTLEQEVNSLTGELIQYQDQILLLYELSQSARHHLEYEPIIHTYLATGRKLLQVEQLYLIVTPAESDPQAGETQFGSVHIKSDPQQIQLNKPRQALFEQLHLQGKESLLRQPLEETVDDAWHSVMALPVPGQVHQRVTLIAINRLLGPFDAPTKKMGLALVDLLGSEMERLSLHKQILDQTRLETEAAMARTVQMRLLPRRAPRIIGLDVHGYSEPARQVGGDYYDFIKLSDEAFFFCLADVSGKGMPAALSMTNLRSAMRTAVRLMPEFDVEAALKQTNESLYDDFTDVEMFATIFCGYYNHVRKSITYSNGGHAPVIFCPVDQPARIIRATGPALGIMPDAAVGCGEIEFGAGDILVAATDGFNETENSAGEMFGYDRLLRLVEQLNHYPAAMIAKILNDEVLLFRGQEPQQDDQTIVVLKGIA